MNRFLKIVALIAALCIGATLFVGCRNEKEISEKLALINEGCAKAIADEIGEVLVYESIDVEKDIEGVIESGSMETHVKFYNNTGEPDFTLKRTVTGEATQYDFVKEGDVMIETYDGKGQYATEAPDIFEQFRIDFDVSDIERIEITPKTEGYKEYALFMTKEYADNFDMEENGLKKDCTDVVYCYYIDNYTNLSTVIREFAYTVTYEGQSQMLYEFIDAKIS